MTTPKYSDYIKKQTIIAVGAAKQRTMHVLEPAQIVKDVEKDKNFSELFKEVDVAGDNLGKKQDTDRNAIIQRADVVEQTINQVTQQLEFQKSAIDEDILQDVRYLFNINVDTSEIEDSISIEEERIEKGEDTFWPTPK